MYEIAEAIGCEQTTETVEDFIQLLSISDNNTNVWAAVHILERIPSNKKTEEKAIYIIKKLADRDSAEALGFKLWLANYKNN